MSYAQVAILKSYVASEHGLTCYIDVFLYYQEEYQVMTATCFVFRNKEDIRAPFEAGANYAATKAGLRLVKIEDCTQELSIFAEWQKSGRRKGG